MVFLVCNIFLKISLQFLLIPAFDCDLDNSQCLNWTHCKHVRFYCNEQFLSVCFRYHRASGVGADPPECIRAPLRVLVPGQHLGRPALTADPSCWPVPGAHEQTQVLPRGCGWLQWGAGIPAGPCLPVPTGDSTCQGQGRKFELTCYFIVM